MPTGREMTLDDPLDYTPAMLAAPVRPAFRIDVHPYQGAVQAVLSDQVGGITQQATGRTLGHALINLGAIMAGLNLLPDALLKSDQEEERTPDGHRRPRGMSPDFPATRQRFG